MAVVPAPAVPWSTPQLRLLHRVQLYVLMVSCALSSAFLVYNVFSPASSCAAKLPPIPQNAFERLKDGDYAPEGVSRRSTIEGSADERRLAGAVGSRRFQNAPSASVGAAGGAEAAGAHISPVNGPISSLAEDSPMPDGRGANALQASPTQEAQLAGFSISTGVLDAAEGEDAGEYPEKAASEKCAGQVQAAGEAQALEAKVSSIDIGKAPSKDSGENPDVYPREAPETRGSIDRNEALGKHLRKTLDEAVGESPSPDPVEAPDQVKSPPSEISDEAPDNASDENRGEDLGGNKFPVENSSDGEGRGQGKNTGSTSASPASARSPSRTPVTANEAEVVYIYLWLAFVYLLLVLVCVVTSLHYKNFLRPSRSGNLKSGYDPSPLISELV